MFLSILRVGRRLTHRCLLGVLFSGCAASSSTLYSKSWPLAESATVAMNEEFSSTQIELTQGHGVFFFNHTDDSLLTIELPLRGRKVQCVSSQFFILQGDLIRTQLPLGPRQGATLSFIDPGTYVATVFGFPSRVPVPLKIVVQ